MEILALLIWFLVWGFICGVVAGNRGRSATAWFFLGFFFSFIAFIILVSIPVINRRSGIVPTVDNDQVKVCPYCAETIKAAAVVCRFCGRDVPPPAATDADPDYDMPGRRLARYMTGRE